MDTFIEFFSFTNPNVRMVVLGSLLLTASSAVVGSFTFLKKRALVGDAVAHSVLPGVCLAFLLSGTKNPLWLIIGAFATGWLSLVFLDTVVKRTKIKQDTAIGLVLSVFFGVGILLLTYIQHSGNASQSGLDSFLFGKAAALVGADVYSFGIVAALLIATVLLLFKELTLFAFDENFATAIGLPVKLLQLLLTTLTVLAVVVGIQAVGVVLMAAMLITPAAAARFWTNNLKTMVVLAASMGAFSGIVGAYISYVAPNMPTGPWIVMVISIMALLSFFLAPKKGILYKVVQQRRHQRHILKENILKAFYHLGEQDGQPQKARSLDELSQKRQFHKGRLGRMVRVLKRQGYLVNEGQGFSPTQAGLMHGRRVVKLHRLWELYLTEYLRIAPDHVHDDAETIEHIITPEIERQLEQKLGYPSVDPHSSAIPYDS